eukprot:9500916-Prorocentrum_lima.AAC.1
MTNKQCAACKFWQYRPPHPAQYQRMFFSALELKPSSPASLRASAADSHQSQQIVGRYWSVNCQLQVGRP